MDLIDIFRAFHPKAAEYTYFSSAHGTFSRIDHMSGHKTSINKFKKTEITSSIFSDHDAMTLEINHKKNTKKHTQIWKLNNILMLLMLLNNVIQYLMLLNNEWVNNEVKEEIKRYNETNENEDTTIQNPRDTQKAILRGKFIAFQAYLNKTRKSSNKPSHLTFKGTWKRTTNKAETEKKGGKNKIRAEINERESLKKWYKISMNPRAGVFWKDKEDW